MKNLPVLPAAVAVLSILVLVASVPAILSAWNVENWARDNLLPGAVSSAVDALLFVGILGVITANAENRRRERLRAALFAELSFLGFVMKACILQAPIDAPNDLANGSGDYKALADALQRLKTSSPVGNAPALQADSFSAIARIVADAVKAKAEIHLRRLQCLTPVAAELEPNTLTMWMEITDSLYAMTRRERFDPAQLVAFGADLEHRYAYDHLRELFDHLAAAGVPQYGSRVV